MAYINSEIWKDINGYEGLYQVSNMGRVKALAKTRLGSTQTTRERRYSEKILKNHVDRVGYCQVQLWKNGHGRMTGVHRLVAQAFVLNPQNHPCVNHIDEDKGNNAASNLEWCDYAYNNRYGTARVRSSAKLSRPILCLDLAGNVVRKFKSQKEAVKFLGVSSNAHISFCCNGKKETAYGYRWAFENYDKKGGDEI